MPENATGQEKQEQPALWEKYRETRDRLDQVERERDAWRSLYEDANEQEKRLKEEQRLRDQGEGSWWDTGSLRMWLPDAVIVGPIHTFNAHRSAIQVEHDHGYSTGGKVQSVIQVADAEDVLYVGLTNSA